MAVYDIVVHNNVDIVLTFALSLTSLLFVCLFSDFNADWFLYPTFS